MVAEQQPKPTHLEKIAAEMDALEDSLGRLTPEAVRERARDPQSEMHAHFTWNIESAADSYQLDQARELIRTVRVQVQTSRKVVLTTRYVRDVALPPQEQGYRNVLRVDEAALSDATVEAEANRVIALIERARGIAAALDREAALIAAIRAALR